MRSKTIVIGVGIVTSLLMLYIAIGWLQGLRQVSRYHQVAHVETGDTVIEEYMTLFSPSMKEYAKPGVSYLLNGRNPFGTFDIRNNNCLIISKLDDTIHVLLTSILAVSQEATAGTMDSVYNAIDEGIFKLDHLPFNKGHIEHVYLATDGDSVNKVMVNDSTVRIHCLAKTFSVKYRSNGPIDIYGGVKYDNQLMLPIDIFFLKRRSALYFAVVSINDRNSLQLSNPFK